MSSTETTWSPDGNSTASGASASTTDLSLTGNLSVTGTSTLTGASTLSSTLAVTGAATLSSTLTVAGDANFDSNTLFVDASTDRVGIGISSPGAILHIAKTEDSATGGTLLMLQNQQGSGDTNAGIILRRNQGIDYSMENNGGNFYIIGGSDLDTLGHTGDNRLTIKGDTGNVGIGTASPVDNLHVAGADDADVAIVLTSYDTDTAGNYPTLRLFRARGTQASPSIVTDGDYLGGIWFGGWLGSTGGDFYTNYDVGASIAGIVDGTPSNSNEDIPVALLFSTSPDSGTVNTERMRIAPNGRIGIGTNAPGQLLEVSGGGSAYIEITADDDGAGTNNAGIILSEEATIMWYVRNKGSSSDRFEVTDASGDGAYLTQNETSEWDWSSDINLKTDISVIPDALSKINQIRGVNYKWKKYKSGASNILPIADAETGLTSNGEDGWTDEYWEEMRSVRDINRIGVIAQEVNAVMPEAVNTDTDGEWTVKRGLLIPLLIEAVKELSAKVTALENA